jgi:hypothetical protein
MLTDGRTDGRKNELTGMLKLIVAFRNLAYALKDSFF